jgi:hypothetical protein
MQKNLGKMLMIAIVFSATFLGFSLSRNTVNVAGETADVTVISLGMQAKAYCNEGTFPEGPNDGKCSGTHNQPDSRCFQAIIGVQKDCKRDF